MLNRRRIDMSHLLFLKTGRENHFIEEARMSMKRKHHNLAIFGRKRPGKGLLRFRLAHAAAMFSLLFLSFTISVYGQTVNSQQITGTVQDTTGAAIPNASVAITNSGTGTTQRAKSDASGRFTVLGIPVGVYTVTATSNGFKTGVVQGVQVDVGSIPNVQVALEVGNQSTTVTVTDQNGGAVLHVHDAFHGGHIVAE